MARKDLYTCRIVWMLTFLWLCSAFLNIWVACEWKVVLAGRHVAGASCEFYLQNEIKTRCKNFQTQASCSYLCGHLCGQSPFRIGTRDHHMQNIVKHRETRLKHGRGSFVICTPLVILNEHRRSYHLSRFCCFDIILSGIDVIHWNPKFQIQVYTLRIQVFRVSGLDYLV